MRPCYPNGGDFCDWCGERLRSLNHMVNPVELMPGEVAYLCQDCVDDFMALVGNSSYAQAVAIQRGILSRPIDKVSHE